MAKFKFGDIVQINNPSIAPFGQFGHPRPGQAGACRHGRSVAEKVNLNDSQNVSGSARRELD